MLLLYSQLLFPEIGVVDHRVMSCFCDSPCFKTTRNIKLRKSTSSPSARAVPPTAKEDEPSTSKEDEPTTSKEDEPTTSKEDAQQSASKEDEPSTSKEDVAMPSVLQPLTPENAAIDLYCLVLYDGKSYPGQIKDTDVYSVEVNTMNKVGNNRFFWPAAADCIWYNYDDVLSIIPPPIKVSSRIHMIDPQFWNEIAQLLDEE